MKKSLDNQEHQFILDLRRDYNVALAEIGLIEFQLSEIEKSLLELKAKKDNALIKCQEYKTKELKFAEKLFEKYGSGNVDIETGEIEINNS